MSKQLICLLFLLALPLVNFAQEDDAETTSPALHIQFEADPKQVYGFDDFRYEAWKEHYDLLESERIQGYRIAHKSVAFNETDVVVARIEHFRASVYDSLSFRIAGVEKPLKYVREANHKLRIVLPAMNRDYNLSAFVGSEEVGRLMVSVYTVRTERVIVVPLAGVRFHPDTLQQRINELYRQANVQLKIEVRSQFVSPEFDAKTLFDNPSPANDRYTNQMRNLRDLYFEEYPDAPEEAFYVFLIPGFTDPELQGYMVRNKTIAFLKTARARKLSYAMARELARGIGLVKDSWHDNGPEAGTTDNLMDRSGGKQLAHFQWEELRHSTHSYSRFDNYEDVRTNNGLVAYYFWKENRDGTITFQRRAPLKSIHRPFKKNYFSYHLNIDRTFYKTLFTVWGRLISTWHILAALVVIAGSVYGGRKLNRYLRKRFRRSRLLRFTGRILQFSAMIGLIYLSFLLVNLGYGWFEVYEGEVEQLQGKSVTKAIWDISDNANPRYPSETVLGSEILVQRGKKWTLSRRKPVLYFSVTKNVAGNWSGMKLLSHSDSLILPRLDFREKAKSHYIVVNYVAEDGSFERQQVFNHLGVDITDKLKIPDPAKRILVFVNGYRPTSIGHTFEENFSDIRKKGLEYPDSRNLVYTFDRYDYWRPWQGMDLLFQKRINPVETFYADGHFSVSTSNHMSLINFSLTSTLYPKRCTNGKRHTCGAAYSETPGLFGVRKVKTMSLHRTQPNKKGFEKRRRNGQIAGRNIYQMLNELPNGSQNDTLYIVAHSMGFAYSLGIVEELRGKIHFGGFYIIAPENAACGNVNLAEWKEVWQYGSHFSGKDRDAACLQDGVAPQTRVHGLRNTNRVYIPRNLYAKKGFFNSHFIGYYTWLFDIGKGERGYITQR